MRKLGACSVLAACVFCFLGWLTPLKAHADNVTLTLENVGPGNNSGGVYTYPYNFSIDGNGSYVSLMCFDYNNEIYAGETWTATVVPIGLSFQCGFQPQYPGTNRRRCAVGSLGAVRSWADRAHPERREPDRREYFADRCGECGRFGLLLRLSTVCSVFRLA